ncbi:hypothetical protein [Thermolongibacillus altinsuensis]|jgi:hypothetical protein|uniref:hypothetical protein n=1 Tax=Thermolongibacillus altinsuensis TaxID=575256 RepID=UPI00242A2C4D|nr:hypothetical protein [Thermolongibacillus altinsuensis]GMB08348.1 hypothetical protein B1no1_10580 [Thermolongibacillus altinsuensis]
MSIILAIVICCAVAGSLLWSKRRVLSLILFTPLLTILALSGYVAYQSWYHTTPDSLHLSVHKENETYVVKGKWKDRLDWYRFHSDFLVFYVSNNEKISNVKRERSKYYEDMDVELLHGDIAYWIEEHSHPKGEPQIFDIQTDKQFQFSFVLPDDVKPSNVKLYYVHAREEPMDALEYWIKNVELK